MKAYFYGYYFKCQSDSQTLALIAATHGAGKNRTCSLQVITESGAWVAEFPKEAYFQKGSLIKIGENKFSRRGIRVNLKTEDLRLTGNLKFGPITPLKYDIMGPFALIPGMECRHMVGSLSHPVNGKLTVNGVDYVFDNARGYWEGDTGRSFPKEYLWTQSFLPEGGSLMLSVADIPFPGFTKKLLRAVPQRSLFACPEIPERIDQIWISRAISSRETPCFSASAAISSYSGLKRCTPMPAAFFTRTGP